MGSEPRADHHWVDDCHLKQQLYNAPHNGRDDLVQRLDIGRADFAVSEEEMDRSDERGRERRKVGGGCDATQRLFFGQVCGDHRGALRDERKARGSGLAEAGSQSVAHDDQRHHCHGERGEHRGKCHGEVVDDRARANCVVQRTCGRLELGRSIEDELREERVEVDEVAVHHTFRDPSFGRDGAARQAACAISGEHSFGRIEQQLSRAGEVDSGRHSPPPFLDAYLSGHGATYSGHMTTLPPDPQQFSASESHHARQIAESFGSEADRYERTRPAYPQAMVDAILAASTGRDVLDVGIGTGISARPFQQAGCRVLGVEPDERMAAFARHSGIAIEIAKFEEWHASGRTFDLVIAGQTWHWVDPVIGASKAAEVLRPGGRIALFWNVMSFPPEFAEGFSAVYRRVLPEFPFFQSGSPGGTASYAPLTEKAVDGIGRSGAFTEPEQWQFDWGRSYTRDEWLEQVPTFGGHSQIPPEKLAELLSGIGDAIDAAGGSFLMGYNAVVVTACREN